MKCFLFLHKYGEWEHWVTTRGHDFYWLTQRWSPEKEFVFYKRECKKCGKTNIKKNSRMRE